MTKGHNREQSLKKLVSELFEKQNRMKDFQPRKQELSGKGFAPNKDKKSIQHMWDLG